MITKYVRLRDRNQITLPAEIIEGLGVDVGDFLEISRVKDNLIRIRPTELVIMNTEMSDQAEDRALQPEAMAKAREITSVDELEALLENEQHAGREAKPLRAEVERAQDKSSRSKKYRVTDLADAAKTEEKLREATEGAVRRAAAAASQPAKYKYSY